MVYLLGCNKTYPKINFVAFFCAATPHKNDNKKIFGSILNTLFAGDSFHEPESGLDAD
jgi:hypothetical protein